MDAGTLAPLYPPPQGTYTTIPPITTQFSNDQLIFPYDFYHLTTEYVWDNGQVHLPVAYETLTATVAPTEGNAALVQETCDPSLVGFLERQAGVAIPAAAAYGYKIVRFDAQRKVVQPEIPQPDNCNANEILLTVRTSAHAPIPTKDGNYYVYRVSGEIRYALLQPYWYSDGYTGGASPTGIASAADNAIPVDNFASDIAG